jgi:uncharacterized protein (TIRG00374 family)
VTGAKAERARAPHRVPRRLVRIGGGVGAGVLVLILLPGLGELRSRFEDAEPLWLAFAALAEVLSTLSYVPAFRFVFCTRMQWSTSYKLALAEEGANSVLPAGGAGGLALGAWALRRIGMPTAEIARKTVGFFLLTSAPNVGALVLVGLGLAIGVLPGRVPAVLAIGPAAAACAAIALALALPRIARRFETALNGSTCPPRRSKLVAALRATVDGVDVAVDRLRTGDPVLLAGLLGYMLFDILAMWASFRAVGAAPQLAVVFIAYLVGQLGNLIPLPGGVGGVELGLIGAFVLYGEPAVEAAAAVLLYRALELVLPAALGGAAFVQLRRLLDRGVDTINTSSPALGQAAQAGDDADVG